MFIGKLEFQLCKNFLPIIGALLTFICPFIHFKYYRELGEYGSTERLNTVRLIGFLAMTYLLGLVLIGEHSIFFVGVVLCLDAIFLFLIRRIRGKDNKLIINVSRTYYVFILLNLALGTASIIVSLLN